MTRRRRATSKSRHKQRQMLVAVQILLMAGILAFVVLFRDHFGILTSSFVSGFGAQDVQVKDKERGSTPPNGATTPPKEENKKDAPSPK